MPEISIIVPVYRAESYLAACISSILSQSFRDFELLLVDDGSPDRCLELCREYEKKDSRIRVFHQENQGQSAARNLALEHARGRWVCFVDSDDQIHSQMVQLLYDAAQNGGISMCAMLEAPELPADFDQPVVGEFAACTMDDATLAAMLDREEYPGWVACAKLIPRSIVQEHLFCPGRVYEDNEAVCHWLLSAGTLHVSRRQLYFYRTNPISTTQTQFSLKRLDYLWALENIIRFYHGEGYPETCRRFADRYAETAADYYRQVNQMGHTHRAQEIRRNARALFRDEKIPLTGPQFAALLDGFHPKLMPLYWPVSGAMRALRSGGIPALTKKLLSQFRKGD